MLCSALVRERVSISGQHVRFGDGVSSLPYSSNLLCHRNAPASRIPDIISLSPLPAREGLTWLPLLNHHNLRSLSLMTGTIFSRAATKKANRRPSFVSTMPRQNQGGPTS